MHSPQDTFKASLVLVLVIVMVTWPPSLVESWSPSQNNHRNINVESSRRQLFQKSASVACAAAAALVSTPSDAGAACLQGDLRPVCIGYYKVPIDENITPEELQKFAPDLKYVPPIEYPKSFQSAMSVLKTQRADVSKIQQHVMNGNLEEAGILVLALLPQVTSSCQRIMTDLDAMIRNKGDGTSSEVTARAMAIDRAEDQMSYVTGCWGECDVTIGQGMRGELGGFTVAQLAILSSIRDASGALDDFMATASTMCPSKTYAESRNARSA